LTYFTSTQEYEGGIALLLAVRNIVLVKLDAKQEATRSGIILAPLAQERATMGEVIAVGPGRVDDEGNRVPVEFVVGQRVLVRKYCGEMLDVKVNIMAVYDHDIEGVITKEPSRVDIDEANERYSEEG
jgi:co-chaperonin GroES (HSP10)